MSNRRLVAATLRNHLSHLLVFVGSNDVIRWVLNTWQERALPLLRQKSTMPVGIVALGMQSLESRLPF
jgi:hypothetical protein